VRGRSVRQWSSAATQSGELREPFVAVDHADRPLASGVYFVEAIVGGRGTSTRISLVR